MNKATDFISEDLRFDLRRQRATQLAGLIMKEMGDYVARASQREVYDRLLELLMEIGVDFITDRDRQNAGLPPRDDKGWTRQEVVALEELRLQQLLTPIATTIILPKD